MMIVATHDPGRIRDGRAGFTLVEVLVALVLSAFCLMMLSGIVGRLTATQRTVRQHAEILDQADAVFRLLRGLVRSVDVEMTDARQGNLTGQAREFSVLSLGPVVLGLDAQTIFRLHVVPPGDPSRTGTGTLALAWTNPTDGSSFDETIATGVEALQLAYRPKRGTEGWASTWTGRTEDLALVKATITFAGSDGAESASAMLAVGSKLPQICVVEPLHDRCPSW